MQRAAYSATLFALSTVVMEMVDDALENNDEAASLILGRARDGIIATAEAIEAMEKPRGLD